MLHDYSSTELHATTPDSIQVSHLPSSGLPVPTPLPGPNETIIPHLTPLAASATIALHRPPTFTRRVAAPLRVGPAAPLSAAAADQLVALRRFGGATRQRAGRLIPAPYCCCVIDAGGGVRSAAVARPSVAGEPAACRPPPRPAHSRQTAPGGGAHARRPSCWSHAERARDTEVCRS